MGDKERKPYSSRSDIEKIKSNWNKISGLIERKEWSSAIVRAATATEIAANYVIRSELQVTKNLKPKFVDSLLISSNGIHGKYVKIILPYFKEENLEFHKKFKGLFSVIEKINSERNSIVHSGQFKKEVTANNIIEKSRKVIMEMIKPYDANFNLP